MDSEYLKSTVGEPLSQAMAAAVIARPADLTTFIADWLVKYVEVQEYLTTKAEAAAALAAATAEAQAAADAAAAAAAAVAADKAAAVAELQALAEKPEPLPPPPVYGPGAFFTVRAGAKQLASGHRDLVCCHACGIGSQ